MRNNHYSISHIFNRYLILAIVISPFLAYFLRMLTGKDLLTTLTLFSYLGIVLILFFSFKKNQIRFPLYLLFYLLFIIYNFYSTLYILDRDFEYRYLITSRLIGAFNFMFIIENFSLSKKDFTLILKLSKNILIIAILVIFYQHAVDSTFFIPPELLDYGGDEPTNELRLYSIYSYVTWYSNGFGFIPVFLIVVELLDRQRKNILMWLVLGLVYAILTKTRWVMINVFMAFAFLFINHKNKLDRFFKYAFIIPLIMGLSYVALNGMGINAKGIIADRIFESNKKKGSQKSAETRLLAVKIFKDLYWKNAVYGVGNVRYGMGSDEHSKNNRDLHNALRGRSSQLHVGYLMLYYMYGFIGGTLFMIFLFLILKKLYKEAKLTTYWAPFLGILGFGVGNLTFVTFSMYEMGLIIALLVNRYYVTNNTKKLITQ